MSKMTTKRGGSKRMAKNWTREGRRFAAEFLATMLVAGGAGTSVTQLCERYMGDDHAFDLVHPTTIGPTGWRSYSLAGRIVIEIVDEAIAYPDDMRRMLALALCNVWLRCEPGVSERDRPVAARAMSAALLGRCSDAISLEDDRQAFAARAAEHARAETARILGKAA